MYNLKMYMFENCHAFGFHNFNKQIQMLSFIIAISIDVILTDSRFYKGSFMRNRN